jgi:hypothetical protein
VPIDRWIGAPAGEDGNGAAVRRCGTATGVSDSVNEPAARCGGGGRQQSAGPWRARRTPGERIRGGPAPLVAPDPLAPGLRGRHARGMRAGWAVPPGGGRLPFRRDDAMADARWSSGRTRCLWSRPAGRQRAHRAPIARDGRQRADRDNRTGRVPIHEPLFRSPSRPLRARRPGGMERARGSIGGCGRRSGDPALRGAVPSGP